LTARFFQKKKQIRFRFFLQNKIADDPSSIDAGGFSLFASARPAKKKSKKEKRSREKTEAHADVDDGNAAIEAAPPSTPAASKSLSKVAAESHNDADDLPVTFKSLGLSDWLCRYVIRFHFFPLVEH